MVVILFYSLLQIESNLVSLLVYLKVNRRQNYVCALISLILLVIFFFSNDLLYYILFVLLALSYVKLLIKKSYVKLHLWPLSLIM